MLEGRGAVRSISSNLQNRRPKVGSRLVPLHLQVGQKLSLGKFACVLHRDRSHHTIIPCHPIIPFVKADEHPPSGMDDLQRAASPFTRSVMRCNKRGAAMDAAQNVTKELAQ